MRELAGGRPDAPEEAVVRVLREPFASDPRTRAEWLGASWAANRFSHARVPKVLQDGADGRGAPVVVRRWAKGMPLDQLVRNGEASAANAMDPTLALQVVEQVLDALEMAHAHGIVHGALGPSNVIVTERGTVRLVDFATAPGLLARPADALLRARLSPYTAPELRAADWGRGVPPTEASDVWSAGACLHFALTGRPPPPDDPSFEAGKRSERSERRARLARLARRAPEVQPALAAVADRALAIDPRDRYESAYAMLGDIRRVMAGRMPSLQSTGVSLPSSPPGGLRPGRSLEPSGVEEVALMPALPGEKPTSVERSSEWGGNLMLFAAIALLVALATFVLVRERLADVAPRAPLSPSPVAPFAPSAHAMQGPPLG